MSESATDDVQLSVSPGKRAYSDNQLWAQSYVFIGSNTYSETQTLNAYWFLVVDRRSLEIAANETQTANDTVPESVSKLANGPDANNYLLIMCTNGLSTNNLPTGDLYSFLHTNGGGPMLARLEQIGAQLGCGMWSGTTYGLVDILGEGGVGFETLVSGTPDNGLMTLKLIPFEIDGENYYTPARLDG